MLTAAPSVTGKPRFRNKKDRPRLKKNAVSLSGQAMGKITRKIGVSGPGPVKERDERWVRNKIEKSRRPINYGKARPNQVPDRLPDVVNKGSFKIREKQGLIPK